MKYKKKLKTNILILAIATAVIAGGLAYWVKEENNAQEEYNTQSNPTLQECEAQVREGTAKYGPTYEASAECLRKPWEQDVR